MLTSQKPASAIISITAALTLPLVAGALVSCTAATAPETDEASSSSASPSGSSATPRANSAPILGAVSPHGNCDPEIIDIDHERPTAHITYTGHEGDHIVVQIRFTDDSGAAQTKDSEFTLAKGMTGMQLPTDVPNDSISEISVSALSGSGQPGTCKIPVNGAR